jgi:predicted metalloprotease with PDZ domain
MFVAAMVLLALTNSAQAIDPANAQKKGTPVKDQATATTATTTVQKPVLEEEVRPNSPTTTTVRRVPTVTTVAPGGPPATTTFIGGRDAYVIPSGRSIDWILGVRATSTSSGVRIEEVFRNTPAWDWGLEQGDYILAVEGYPVGLIEGRTYSLDSEMRRVRNGVAELEVYDFRHRQRLLMNVELGRR